MGNPGVFQGYPLHCPGAGPWPSGPGADPGPCPKDQGGATLQMGVFLVFEGMGRVREATNT